MRDYKGYRLYAATRYGDQVAFITRNDGGRVWGIGFVLSDEELGRQTHARIEGWERDPGDPWADAYLFDRSEYTNVREVEIDPSQLEDRYVVEAVTGHPGYNYILRDTKTNEFSLWWTEFNAKQAARGLNGDTHDRISYTWSEADDTPEEETVPAGTDYKAAYEKTIEALRKEAEKRGWCTEFDEFVKDNNLPETLVETKVRVTLELKVPGRTPTIGDIEDAVAAATSVQGFKNVEWETI